VITAATADQLDAVATSIEAAAGPSSTLNSALLKALREPALTIQGIKLATTAAAYTSNLATALKLRPKGHKFALQELAVVPVRSVAGFERLGANPGEITGGAGARSPCATMELATCAAIARVWAAIVRTYLGLSA
jgi:hypothetical protein